MEQNLTDSVNGKAETPEDKLTAASKRLVGDFEGYFAEVFADTDFELKLYRCEVSGRKIKRTFLKRFVNEWPKEENIGIEFGGGHYDIRGTHPLHPDKLHSKEIHIDPIWDRRKRENDRELAEIQQPGFVRPQTDPFEMIAKAVTALEPLLKTMGGSTAPANPLEQMAGVMEGFQKMMLNGVTEINKMQITAVKDIKKQSDELRNTEPENQENTNMMDHLKLGILETIKSAADTFLNSKGVTEKMYKSAIKGSDEYQALIEDQQVLSEVYTEAILDPEIGKEKIDALFKKLGIEVPEDLPETEKPVEAPNG